MTFRKAKQICRAYLRERYSNANLVEALERARAGTLWWWLQTERPCMCFSGLVHPEGYGGLLLSLEIGGAGYHEVHNVSAAYYAMGEDDKDDGRRQRIIVPLILAEIRRRERTQAAIPEITPAEVAALEAQQC